MYRRDALVLAFLETCDKLKFMRLLTTLVAFVALGVGAFAAPPVPRPAKELEIDQPNGKNLLLTSFRGKVVVVQFLYTTCPHCQAFSQTLTKLQNEYGPRGFQALGGAFNEADNNMVINYVKQYKVGFPVGVLVRDTVMNFMGFSLMDRLVVPQIALIDRKGQIREQTESNPATMPLQDEAHLRAAIEKLLAEGAGTTKSGAPAGGSTKATAPANKPQS
jgi:thiol-disulfide isomerase/thioredoxin